LIYTVGSPALYVGLVAASVIIFTGALLVIERLAKPPSTPAPSTSVPEPPSAAVVDRVFG
jgi:hypothetical protein